MSTVLLVDWYIVLKIDTCRHAGKGKVNNSYCNNGVLVGAELVLQCVTMNKEIHLFPTCPSSLICLTSVSHMSSSHSMIYCHIAGPPTDMPVCLKR